MLSGELVICVPSATTVGGSFRNRGVIVLMYVTTSRMSAPERSGAQPGIALPYRPWLTDRIRSSSVGTLLVSVDRILYLPDVKSSGRGVSIGDAGPSPLPVLPWHSTQCASYTTLPCAADPAAVEGVSARCAESRARAAPARLAQTARTMAPVTHGCRSMN